MRQLLALIEEHRQAFAYDWRARFHLPISAVYDGRMTWGEAWHLTQVLLADPSSQVAASVAGWQYPATREALALADMWDLTFRIHAGKKAGNVAYSRPWETPKGQRGDSRRFGDASLFTPEQVRAILKARGPQPEAPLARRDARGRLHGPDGRFVAAG